MCLCDHIVILNLGVKVCLDITLYNKTGTNIQNIVFPVYNFQGGLKN